MSICVSKTSDEFLSSTAVVRRSFNPIILVLEVAAEKSLLSGACAPSSLEIGSDLFTGLIADEFRTVVESSELLASEVHNGLVLDLLIISVE